MLLIPCLSLITYTFSNWNAGQVLELGQVQDYVSSGEDGREAELCVHGDSVAHASEATASFESESFMQAKSWRTPETGTWDIADGNHGVEIEEIGPGEQIGQVMTDRPGTAMAREQEQDISLHVATHQGVTIQRKGSLRVASSAKKTEEVKRVRFAEETEEFTTDDYFADALSDFSDSDAREVFVDAFSEFPSHLEEKDYTGLSTVYGQEVDYSMLATQVATKTTLHDASDLLVRHPSDVAVRVSQQEDVLLTDTVVSGLEDVSVEKEVTWRTVKNKDGEFEICKTEKVRRFELGSTDHESNVVVEEVTENVESSDIKEQCSSVVIEEMDNTELEEDIGDKMLPTTTAHNVQSRQDQTSSIMIPDKAHTRDMIKTKQKLSLSAKKVAEKKTTHVEAVMGEKECSTNVEDREISMQEGQQLSSALSIVLSRRSKEVPNIETLSDEGPLIEELTCDITETGEENMHLRAPLQSQTFSTSEQTVTPSDFSTKGIKADKKSIELAYTTVTDEHMQMEEVGTISQSTQGRSAEARKDDALVPCLSDVSQMYTAILGTTGLVAHSDDIAMPKTPMASAQAAVYLDSKEAMVAHGTETSLSTTTMSETATQMFHADIVPSDDMRSTSMITDVVATFHSTSELNNVQPSSQVALTSTLQSDTTVALIEEMNTAEQPHDYTLPISEHTVRASMSHNMSTEFVHPLPASAAWSLLASGTEHAATETKEGISLPLEGLRPNSEFARTSLVTPKAAVTTDNTLVEEIPTLTTTSMILKPKQLASKHVIDHKTYVAETRQVDTGDSTTFTSTRHDIAESIAGVLINHGPCPVIHESTTLTSQFVEMKDILPDVQSATTSLDGISDNSMAVVTNLPELHDNVAPASDFLAPVMTPTTVEDKQMNAHVLAPQTSVLAVTTYSQSKAVSNVPECRASEFSNEDLETTAASQVTQAEATTEMILVSEPCLLDMEQDLKQSSPAEPVCAETMSLSLENVGSSSMYLVELSNQTSQVETPDRRDLQNATKSTCSSAMSSVEATSHQPLQAPGAVATLLEAQDTSTAITVSETQESIGTREDLPVESWLPLKDTRVNGMEPVRSVTEASAKVMQETQGLEMHSALVIPVRGQISNLPVSEQMPEEPAQQSSYVADGIVINAPVTGLAESVAEEFKRMSPEVTASECHESAKDLPASTLKLEEPEARQLEHTPVSVHQNSICETTENLAIDQPHTPALLTISKEPKECSGVLINETHASEGHLNLSHITAPGEKAEHTCLPMEPLLVHESAMLHEAEPYVVEQAGRTQEDQGIQQFHSDATMLVTTNILPAESFTQMSTILCDEATAQLSTTALLLSYNTSEQICTSSLAELAKDKVEPLKSPGLITDEDTHHTWSTEENVVLRVTSNLAQVTEDIHKLQSVADEEHAVAVTETVPSFSHNPDDVVERKPDNCFETSAARVTARTLVTTFESSQVLTGGLMDNADLPRKAKPTGDKLTVKLEQSNTPVDVVQTDSLFAPGTVEQFHGETHHPSYVPMQSNKTHTTEAAVLFSHGQTRSPNSGAEHMHNHIPDAAMAKQVNVATVLETPSDYSKTLTEMQVGNASIVLGNISSAEISQTEALHSSSEPSVGQTEELYRPSLVPTEVNESHATEQVAVDNKGPGEPKEQAHKDLCVSDATLKHEIADVTVLALSANSSEEVSMADVAAMPDSKASTSAQMPQMDLEKSSTTADVSMVQVLFSSGETQRPMAPEVHHLTLQPFQENQSVSTEEAINFCNGLSIQQESVDVDKYTPESRLAQETASVLAMESLSAEHSTDGIGDVPTTTAGVQVEELATSAGVTLNEPLHMTGNLLEDVTNVHELGSFSATEQGECIPAEIIATFATKEDQHALGKEMQSQLPNSSSVSESTLVTAMETPTSMEECTVMGTAVANEDTVLPHYGMAAVHAPIVIEMREREKVVIALPSPTLTNEEDERQKPDEPLQGKPSKESILVQPSQAIDEPKQAGATITIKTVNKEVCQQERQAHYSSEHHLEDREPCDTSDVSSVHATEDHAVENVQVTKMDRAQVKDGVEVIRVAETGITASGTIAEPKPDEEHVPKSSIALVDVKKKKTKKKVTGAQTSEAFCAHETALRVETASSAVEVHVGMDKADVVTEPVEGFQVLEVNDESKTDVLATSMDGIAPTTASLGSEENDEKTAEVAGVKGPVKILTGGQKSAVGRTAPVKTEPDFLSLKLKPAKRSEKVFESMTLESVELRPVEKEEVPVEEAVDEATSSLVFRPVSVLETRAISVPIMPITGNREEETSTVAPVEDITPEVTAVDVSRDDTEEPTVQVSVKKGRKVKSELEEMELAATLKQKKKRGKDVSNKTKILRHDAFTLTRLCLCRESMRNGDLLGHHLHVVPEPPSSSSFNQLS